jgi:hypothetical protein
MTIIQQPSDFNFAGNLPDIIVESTDNIQFTLLKNIGVRIVLSGGSSVWPVGQLITGQTSGATGYVQSYNNPTLTLILERVTGTFQAAESLLGESTGGGVSTVEQLDEILLDEIYTPDSNDNITIELREFFENYLEVIVPSQADSVYIQSRGYGEFIVEIDDEDFAFTVIYGGGRNLPEIIGQRFHTWQPAIKYIQYADYNSLTFFPLEDCVINAKIYHGTGQIDDLQIAELSGLQLASFNITPYLIASEFEDVTQIDVTVVFAGSSDADLIKQTFMLHEEHFDFNDLFVFVNSLGGVDAIRFTGRSEAIEQFQIDTALFNRDTLEYFSASDQVYNKSTGIFRSRRELLWARDFFASVSKYIFKHFLIQRIRTSGTYPSIRHEANSYDFQYAISEPTVYQDYFEFNPPTLPVKPSAPSDFAATAVSTSQIDLSWVDNTDGEALYDIERSLNGADWTVIHTTDPGAQSYESTGLDDGTIYYYRIRADIDGTTSAYTSSVYSVTWYNFANGLEFDATNDFAIRTGMSNLVIGTDFDSITLVGYFKKIPFDGADNLFNYREGGTKNIGLSHSYSLGFQSIALNTAYLTTVSPNVNKLFTSVGTDVIMVYFKVDFAAKTIRLRVNDTTPIDATFATTTVTFFDQMFFGQTSGGSMRVGDWIVFKDEDLENVVYDNLYNAGKGIDVSKYLTVGNIVAHWKFNETTGNTANDSSANARHLTLNNFTGVDADKWKTF